MEPMFEETIDENYVPLSNSTSGPVFLVKEDNITSEQIFVIVIQVVNSSFDGSTYYNAATLSVDYYANTESVVQFLPGEERTVVEFTLLPDNFSENTEAFLAILSSINTVAIDNNMIYHNVSTFLPPMSLSNRTYIKIIDNDRKFLWPKIQF